MGVWVTAGMLQNQGGSGLMWGLQAYWAEAGADCGGAETVLRGFDCNQHPNTEVCNKHSGAKTTLQLGRVAARQHARAFRNMQQSNQAAWHDYTMVGNKGDRLQT